MVELMLVIIRVGEAMLATNRGLTKVILYQYFARTAKDLTYKIVALHNLMELHPVETIAIAEQEIAHPPILRNRYLRVYQRKYTLWPFFTNFRICG